MGKLIGYARVSKEEQTLELQVDALIKAGCNPKDIFKEKVSGTKTERPALAKCLQTLQKGDTLVVWRLDRLGRSMAHLVSLVEDFKKRDICFKSLGEGAIDTTSVAGELIFNIFACLAHFERRLIQERTLAGLSAARARGRLGGRKPIKADDPRVIIAKKMFQDKSLNISEICRSLNISRTTLYRFLAITEVKKNS